MTGEDGEGFAVVLGGHVVGVVPQDLRGFYLHCCAVAVLNELCLALCGSAGGTVCCLWLLVVSWLLTCLQKKMTRDMNKGHTDSYIDLKSRIGALLRREFT